MMQFVTHLRIKSRKKTMIDLKKFSPVALHFALAFGVALYTLFGALVMQWLEMPSETSSLSKRSVDIVNSTHLLEDLHHIQKRQTDLDWREKYSETRVFLGHEIGEIDPEVHKCVQLAVANLLERSSCADIDRMIITPIDWCYQKADYDKYFEKYRLASEQRTTTEETKRKTKEELIEEEVEYEINKWNFENAVIFAFTVITTIGYGHVAPITFYGRLFCILYGTIGVPITLLTIADMGMFISMCLRKFTQFVKTIPHLFRKLMRLAKRKAKTPGSARSTQSTQKTLVSNGKLKDVEKEPLEEENVEDEEEEEPEAEDVKKADESICLGILFALYLMFGAKVLSSYEPDMEYFEAFYFNFVTLTTIGLGDFVPKSYDYLFVTLVYIGVGLALTTMAVEIAADTLKKLHHFGRKIENVGATMVWFGGKKMTMKALIKNLADQLNIPVSELEKFDINQFVDDAIKVEAGEKETLRKPEELEKAISYTNLRRSADENSISFMDDRLTRRTDEPPLALETARTITSFPMADESRENPSTPRVPPGRKSIPNLHFGSSIQSYTSNDEYSEEYEGMLETPKQN